MLITSTRAPQSQVDGGEALLNPWRSAGEARSQAVKPSLIQLCRWTDCACSAAPDRSIVSPFQFPIHETTQGQDERRGERQRPSSALLCIFYWTAARKTVGGWVGVKQSVHAAAPPWSLRRRRRRGRGGTRCTWPGLTAQRSAAP